MYINRNFDLPILNSQPSLGQIELSTATRNLLSSQMPVWQTLLIGFGAIAGIVWIAGGIQREVKHAQRQASKSLGL